MARHTVFDKSKLPSRHATVGPDRAPNRSYYFAMGLRREDIDAPFVGVVTTWNEAAPCNIALARQAQAAKRGVAKAGGTPPDRDRQDHRREPGGRDLRSRPGGSPAELGSDLTSWGGVVGLKGSLAPEGAIVKWRGSRT